MKSRIDDPLGVNRQADELTIWVGGTSRCWGIPASGLLLVLEADLERAQQIKAELQQSTEVAVCNEVLLAESGAEVDWFSFNDESFDGPVSVDHWQVHYPDLRQLGVERRCGRRLEQVLDAWRARLGLQQLPQIQLLMHQGDPLAALEGLGVWRSQLQVVRLHERYGKTESAAAAWLDENGLQPDEYDELTWRILISNKAPQAPGRPPTQRLGWYW